MRQPFTLILTGAPDFGAVSETVIDAARAALTRDAEARWLAPDTAWEARFESHAAEAAGIRTAVAAAIGSHAVDVNIVRETNGSRRKGLLAADMESTIIREELIDEIADLVGCRDAISAITASAMRGEIAFEAALAQRVALFRGITVDRLAPLLARVTPMPGAETLVLTLRAQGAKCALITGGFTLFAEPIAERLGFDAVAANVLEIEDGVLTGRVREPILGPSSKAEAMTRLAAEYNVSLDDTLAVGDGANDVMMLRAAGLGVAFRAKPILEDTARASDRGAVIRHGDLTALLHLQGYPRDAFAG